MKTRSNRQSKNKTFKANCHPGNKKNIHKNTCYTQRGLYEIKKMYNKAHHYNKIKCTSPYQIYNELRKRLSYCNKETCWMVFGYNSNDLGSEDCFGSKVSNERNIHLLP